MTLALTTSPRPPFTFGSKWVVLNFSRTNLGRHSFPLQSRSVHQLVSTVYSVKVSAAKGIGDLTGASTYLQNLAGQFLGASPQPLKEFPWKKAKLLVEERLILLGKNVLIWSVVALLIFSFVSDVIVTVSVNRELLVPVGLFIGLMLATFLKECCQEFFECGAKGGHDMQRLWSIGLFFVALRFLYLWFRLPGWVLLSHICNGGLLQMLWLAKDEHQAESLQDQKEMDAVQHSEN